MSRLDIQQGADFAVAWDIFAPDGVTPLNISGWSARAQARATTESTTALYNWSNVLGNLVPEAGSLTLSVTAAQSSAWAWQRAVFDVELIDLLGKVASVDRGFIIVIPEVTRS